MSPRRTSGLTSGGGWGIDSSRRDSSISGRGPAGPRREGPMRDAGRREFLSGAGVAAATLFLPRSARAADSRIEVLAGEPIGAIANEIYGHFVEHLGGVVYERLWVGEGSKVPNGGG